MPDPDVTILIRAKNEGGGAEVRLSWADGAARVTPA